MSALARLRASSWAVVVAPTLAAFLFSADTISIQIANPRIAAGLHAGLGGMQWAANGFLLPFCVLIVAAGTLADRLGPRRVLLAGTAVFGAGELLGSFAQTTEVLIAARVLAGVGGAAMMPAGVSALRLQLPESRLVGAMSVWAGGAMAGVASGGVVAGLLLKATSWRGVLWPLAGAAAVAILVALVTLRDVRTPSVQQLRWGWNAGFAAGLGGLVWGLIHAGSAGWGSASALLAIGLGAGAIAATAVWAVPGLRRDAAGIDLPRIGVSFLAVILSNFGIVAVSFFLSIWLQRVAGHSALETGVLLLPFNGVSALVAAFLCGRLIDRFGAPAVLVAGFALELAGMLGTAQLGRDTAYWALAACLVPAGLGLVLTLTGLAMLLLGSAPPDRGGLMSGLQVSANQIGGVVSIALLGALVASSVGPRYADGLERAGLPRVVPPGVRSALAQGIAPAGQPQRAIGEQAFSGAVGEALLIGAGGAAAGLLAALWLARRVRAGRAGGRRAAGAGAA